MWLAHFVVAIPILAAFAAAWGIWRRKWVACVPALLIGLSPATVTASVLEWITQFALHVQPQNLVMTWLLVDVAAVGCLVALWAGWSRAHWFWRLSALAGVPAAMSIVRANEPLVMSLVVLPAIALAAWWVRGRRERRASLASATPAPKHSRFRWQLRDVLLAFVPLGLVALAIRSLVAGPFYIQWEGFLTLAAALLLLSLIAAGACVATTARWRWLAAATCLALIVGVTIVFVERENDVLGLGPFFHQQDIDKVGPGLFLMAVVGIPAAVGVTTLAYVWSVRTNHSKLTYVLAKALLLVLIAALGLPLLLVGGQMLPPKIPDELKLGARPPPDASTTVEQLVTTDFGLRAPWQAHPSERFDARLAVAARILETPDRIWVDLDEYPGMKLAHESDRYLQTFYALFYHFDRALWMAASEGKRDRFDEFAQAQRRLVELLATSNVPEHVTQAEAFRMLVVYNYFDLHEHLSKEEMTAALDDYTAFINQLPGPGVQRLRMEAFRQHCETWRDRFAMAAMKLAVPRAAFEVGLRESDLHKWDQHAIATREAARIQLALEAHRRLHGQWPERLDDLTPEILKALPVDPFDPQGKAPLIYRRTSDGFLLYCRGPDGIDNGGNLAVDSQTWYAPGYDIGLGFDRCNAANSLPWRKLPVGTTIRPSPPNVAPAIP